MFVFSSFETPVISAVEEIDGDVIHLPVYLRTAGSASLGVGLGLRRVCDIEHCPVHNQFFIIEFFRINMYNNTFYDTVS